MALHVVAMARTKNTARSDPYELPRATMAEHIWAITTTTDKETLEVKEKDSRPPAKVKGCPVKNVESVASLDINPTEGEPETLPNPNAGLHTPVFSEITELNLTPVFQNGALNQNVLGPVTLNNTDHPLAFSPTYFSPTLQSLADSPTVEVPMNPVTVLLPLQPLEIGHMVKNDIEHCENIDTENVNVNRISENSVVMEHLGPYRADPNFTQGRKLSNKAIKTSSSKVNIQTRFSNNKIVVARKKNMKRVDRSEHRARKTGKPKEGKPKGLPKMATKVAQKSTPADGGVKKPR